MVLCLCNFVENTFFNVIFEYLEEGIHFMFESVVFVILTTDDVLCYGVGS